ncbi:MAG: T9SS type A sorting domain-containing protein [Chitinophagales bacterium]|nr:T9SS type A sorting domain-containing protein [Chitinophagales bacterium]
MKGILNTLALAVAITFAAANVLLAQNYALSPGDSIVEVAEFDDLTVYNILQNNVSGDSLFMSWQKVSSDVPPTWEALICDNNNCYADLKESGVMHPVIPGEYAFLSVHLTPHTNAGTAIIRYVVWETDNPLSRDTLTWIISSGITGVENQTSLPLSLQVIGDQLFILHTSMIEEISILSAEGKILFEGKGQSLNSVIDLSQFSTGIYLIVARGENFHHTQKIFVQ